VFLFGGNMGRPQYVDLMCNAIEFFKSDMSIYFLFVGRGTDRYRIENAINSMSISNARVVEDMPREEYEQITREIDVGLIVLDPRFTIPNFPSRILSYMEYSKPILAATDNATDLRILIEEAKCGKWIWSGNKDSYIVAIKDMAKNSTRSEMGVNGREYLDMNFTVNESVKILEKHFMK